MAMALSAALLLLSLSGTASQDSGPNCTTCTAAKALPCSGSIAKALVEGAMTYLGNTADAATAFNELTNETRFKQDAGFYVFMYEFAGPCVAHGANANFVGMTLPQIVASVNNPTDGQSVDDALQAGAEADGAWVAYEWTNVVSEPAIRKIAYTDKLTKWGKDYYVGVGFNDVSDALDTSCSTEGAAVCAEGNTLNIMGSLMASLSVTSNITEVFEQITSKTAFRTENGFYAFAYEYTGICVAHGARSDFVGLTLPEIVTKINNPTNGQQVDDALQAGAEAGGDWVTYEWKNNAEEDPYKKIAYVMKFSAGGTDYYFGVGYNHVCMADLAPEQELPVCTGVKPVCDATNPKTEPSASGADVQRGWLFFVALSFYLVFRS